MPRATVVLSLTISGPRGRVSLHCPLVAQVFICGVPRATVVLSLTAASAALAYLTGAITTVLGALFLAAAVILTHASMRTPNLKARLASAREEFRAVWRGYNDYTI